MDISNNFTHYLLYLFNYKHQKFIEYQYDSNI